MNEAVSLPDLPDAAESMGLASRAREGDREALAALLSRHEAWLRRIARIELGARLRRHLDSMDLVQEVELIAFQRIGDLRLTNAASVRGWLRGILGYRLHDLIDRLTAEKRDVRREIPLQPARTWERIGATGFDPSGSETAPDERAAKAEMRELLDELVGQLPEEQRAVVLLRDFDLADWEQIRIALGKPTVSAVRRLHQRAWVKMIGSARMRVGR